VKACRHVQLLRIIKEGLKLDRHCLRGRIE
jgi:hypothetical protein